MSNQPERLAKALMAVSKHSHYQKLHPTIAQCLDVPIAYQPRRLLEEEREEFVASYVNFKGVQVVDIGANTGYFSFAALERGATKVDAYEGNQEHAEFLYGCKSLLGAPDQFIVHNRYVDFEPYDVPNVDVAICYNVLHHLGDDFGSCTNAKEALISISRALRNLVMQNNTSVFQIGYNWKGDPKLPLTKYGTKQEIIDFVHAALDGLNVRIEVGCFMPNDGVYSKACPDNLVRLDAIGEFANRPLFVIHWR